MMSDPKNVEENGAAPEATAETAPETVGQDADDGLQQGDPAALETEILELKDKLLRAMADVENTRRRAAKENRDAHKFAMSSFARELLPVADNLRRALEAIPDEARQGLDEQFSNLLQGIEVTERELLNVFERYGIKPLTPLSEKFDPNFHQAMFEVPNPDVPHNSVAEVIAPGYMIGERVLRPAMVAVAKGGPQAAETAARTAAEATNNADNADKADGGAPKAADIPVPGADVDKQI